VVFTVDEEQSREDLREDIEEETDEGVDVQDVVDDPIDSISGVHAVLTSTEQVVEELSPAL